MREGARALLATLATLLLISAGQPNQVIGQAPASKLTSVLADLARAVPQEPAAAPRGSGPASALSVDALPKSVRDAVRGRRLRLNAQDEVQVYVLMPQVTEAALGQLTAAGITIEIADAAHHRVQARVPASRLELLAAFPFVSFVRLPTYGVRRTGLVDTEGDAILHANDVRSQLSLDGTGVRVGVISDGLKGIFATNCSTCGGVAGGPMATGDLPQATGTRSAQGVLTAAMGGIRGRSFQADGDLEGLPPAIPVCGFPGAGAEGTALLEIVHDIAPGASLSFANADTDLAFEQAVNFLAASNDVVLDDIGFYGEPYDGTSGVSTNTANALNNGSNPIRAYFTAVGNDANEHYYGLYTDAGIDGTSINGISEPGHLHLFEQTADTTDVLGLGPEPYNAILLPRDGEAAIYLTWDDPFGASANNYDLYLVQQSTGRVVASSTDAQTGTQDPVEAIDYVNAGNQDYFRLVVQNVRNAAAPRHLNLYAFQPECARAGALPLAPPRWELLDYNTATRSVSAEGDAGGAPVSVISVGAICSASAAASGIFGPVLPDASCTDTSHSTAEFFGSQGPTIDGRIKPDVSGIDGVSITGAGGFPSPFFGTSAATPHLGGIAALLLQAAPCLANGANGAVDPVTARTALRNLIVANAVGLGSPVPNDTFGAGRADAFQSAGQTLPVVQGPTTLTVSGNTPLGASLTAAQLGFSDPDGCPLAALNWTGGCGVSPGATMNCPFGTDRVGVQASNDGLAFSPSVDFTMTVTNFGLAVAPATAAVQAGQSASYAVTITALGGPYGDAVALACANLPPGAACAFNPATVTPGSGSAQSTLTIATARAGASPPGGRPGHVFPVDGGAGTRAPWLFLTGLLMFLAARAARSGRGLGPALLSLLLALWTLQSACGGSGGNAGSSPPPTGPVGGPGGTPAGTYQMSVTAVSGTLSGSAAVTLVV